MTTLETRFDAGFVKRVARRFLLVGVTTATLYAFRDVHVSAVASILGRVGPIVLLAPLPYAVVSALDAYGMVAIFRMLGRRVRLARVWLVRLACDGLATSLAGGAFVADSLGPVLFQSSSASVSEGVVAVATRRMTLFLSNAAYLGLAVALAFPLLSRASQAVVGVPGALPWLGVAAAVGLTGAALFARATLASGQVASKLHGFLTRIPWVRERLARAEREFVSVDEQFRERVRLGHRDFVLATQVHVVGWLLEAFETWLLLRMVGVHLDLVTVLAFEPMLALVRSLAFFVPAGLGVQEVGYVLFLRAFGVPEAETAGAAFALLKRSKEALFVMVGYAALARLRSPLSVETVQPEVA